MSTEQTGRQSLDTTDSIELVLSPAGGDPTPLPEAHAADGTRKLKAAPPPIPSRTRSSTQTIPPPLPTRTSAQMPAVVQSTTRMPPKPAHVRAKGTQPPVRMSEADPDGWSVPADAAPKAEPSADALAQQIDALAPKLDADGKIEAPKLEAAESVDVNMNDEGEGLRDIMDEDPEDPDATTATPFAEPVVDAGPSKEWLAKIDSVLRPEASKPVAFSKPDGQQPALFTTKAAATMFAATPPQNTEPLELVDLEAVEPPKAKLPAPVAAKPVAAKPAPVAEKPAPSKPAIAIAPQPTVKPLNARRTPIATPGGYPVVSELDGPTDQDAGEFDVDFQSNPDLTSAHTTNFDMPERQRFISQRMAIAMFAGAAVLTVAYLATRGGSHKKPTRVAAAETAQAEAPAPAPQPVVQPITAPAQPVAAPAQPQVQQQAPAQAAVPTPAAPTQGDVIQVPVSSKPSGALVSFVDGGHAVVVGRTPTTIMLDPTQPHDIALTLVDHETQLVTVPIGGMTALAVDMGPEKAGAMAKTPQQVVAAEPREETTAMVAPKAAVKHEAPKHEAPKAQHITQPAPRAETPAAPSGAGTLMISSKPPCEIVVDGKSTHLTTPQRALSLTPGTHTVVLVNAGMKIHKTLAVTISAKKPTKVIQDFTQQ